LSLTVKRVTEDHDGKPVAGAASNYLCDLNKGDQVRVVGPYGTTFLMPNHPGSSLLMVCTGTGSAPMRAMTERRRRRIALKEGGELMLFFGARLAGELPYFGPLLKLPKDFIDINFAFSRVPGESKQYVQDRIRERSADVARLLRLHLRLERHGARRRRGVPRRMPRARHGLEPSAPGAAGTGPLPRGNLLTGTKWRFTTRRRRRCERQATPWADDRDLSSHQVGSGITAVASISTLAPSSISPAT
jgi:Oxidoreductase NAD-binding domain